MTGVLHSMMHVNKTYNWLFDLGGSPRLSAQKCEYHETGHGHFVFCPHGYSTVLFLNGRGIGVKN